LNWEFQCYIQLPPDLSGGLINGNIDWALAQKLMLPILAKAQFEGNFI
jgi:hypothetical protein